jgi:hypothetical protein
LSIHFRRITAQAHAKSPNLARVIPTLLFLRDYHAFQGGHLKVADYIAHTRTGGLWTPQLFMTPGSRSDHPFPRDAIVPRWNPAQADALFVAGMDWLHLPSGIEDHVPVINLIQHPRHAVPDDPRAVFLTRRATRIGVSEEVSEAIRRPDAPTGQSTPFPQASAFLPFHGCGNDRSRC